MLGKVRRKGFSAFAVIERPFVQSATFIDELNIEARGAATVESAIHQGRDFSCEIVPAGLERVVKLHGD